MTNWMKAAALALAGMGVSAQSAMAQDSTWLREGTDTITVSVKGGKLYCTRASDGFEMCHGMTAQGPNTWSGPGMKHPDMPGFMTFAGTVVMGSKNLKIEGCVLGGAICDAEIWTRQ